MALKVGSETFPSRPEGPAEPDDFNAMFRISHWTRGNYIVLSNYSTTYQMVDMYLAVTMRSEGKQSLPYSEAMTIHVQQATPYTCLRTCDCSMFSGRGRFSSAHRHTGIV